MGLSVYFQDIRRDRIGHVGDDPEDSFRQMCQTAPRESLCSGISRYGETLFNLIQTRRFVEELEALPDAEKTPVIRQVLAEAAKVIVRSGYIHFVGD